MASQIVQWGAKLAPMLPQAVNFAKQNAGAIYKAANDAMVKRTNRSIEGHLAEPTKVSAASAASIVQTFVRNGATGRVLRDMFPLLDEADIQVVYNSFRAAHDKVAKQLTNDTVAMSSTSELSYYEAERNWLFRMFPQLEGDGSLLRFAEFMQVVNAGNEAALAEQIAIRTGRIPRQRP